MVGHSWGGFSTMNIAAIHPQITHVVSMSGFLSVERIVRQSLGTLKAYTPALVEAEQRENPRHARYNGLESLSKTSAKVLLVYSDDDKTVHKAVHCDPLLEKLEGKSNIHFLIVSGKDHNPTFTYEGLKQKTDFFNRCQKAIKKKQLETPEQQKAFMDQFDWEFITRQDMEVWQKIFDHLRS